MVLHISATDYLQAFYETDYDFEHLQAFKDRTGLQCNYGQLFEYLACSLGKASNIQMVLVDSENFHFRLDLDVFHHTKFALDCLLLRSVVSARLV